LRFGQAFEDSASRPPLGADQKQVARTRLARMTAGVLAFALGCATAVLIYSRTGVYCFAVPPLLGIGTLVLSTGAFEGGRRW